MLLRNEMWVATVGQLRDDKAAQTGAPLLMEGMSARSERRSNDG
jgi:hypothetical protein